MCQVSLFQVLCAVFSAGSSRGSTRCAHHIHISRSLPLSVKSLFSPFVSKQCPRSQINLSYVSKISPSVIPSVWDTTKHSLRMPWIIHSFFMKGFRCVCHVSLLQGKSIDPCLFSDNENKQVTSHSCTFLTHILTNGSDKQKKCTGNKATYNMHMCIKCAHITNARSRMLYVRTTLNTSLCS